MGKSFKGSGKHDSKHKDTEPKHKLKHKKFKQRDASDAQLIELLRQDGFEIHYMEGDGNCLFRSVAHQLTGEPAQHPYFRNRVLTYIRKNQEHFSLFLEDDEKFSDYMDRMKVLGEWGGHLELYAVTQCCNVTIVVHQLDSPNYKLPAASANSKAEIHLSYHGECHYNSVKRMNDNSVGVSEWDPADPTDDRQHGDVVTSKSSKKDSKKKSKDNKKSAIPIKAASASSTASATTSIVTFETTKEDYVLVDLEKVSQDDPYESQTAASTTTTIAIGDGAAPEEEQEEHALDPLSAFTTGLSYAVDYVTHVMTSLSTNQQTHNNNNDTTQAVSEAEKQTIQAPESNNKAKKKKGKGELEETVLSTRSGRPMSKKERRQHEKQMEAKTKTATTTITTAGSNGCGVAAAGKGETERDDVIDDEDSSRYSTKDSNKKEIIL